MILRASIGKSKQTKQTTFYTRKADNSCTDWKLLDSKRQNIQTFSTGLHDLGSSQAFPGGMSGSRRVPDIRESILWTQRIEKEDKVNATSHAAFSIRAAVSVDDVPAKFKPGHVNPQKDGLSTEGFDPAKHGWDPDGPEAREFRRCIAMQAAGSRQRYPYPETSYQEHGWLLLPPGDAAARMRKKKIRYGVGWEWKAPCDFSESNVSAPLVTAPSCLSVAPPSALSVLSSIPESHLLALQQGSGATKKSSVLSASAPNILAPRFGEGKAPTPSDVTASTVLGPERISHEKDHPK